jgi:hypothetical protein
LYATITVGVDVSKFIKIYDKNGGPVNIYDDSNDAVSDVVVDKLAYQTGGADTCGTVSGTNAWCVEMRAHGCILTALDPLFMGILANDIKTTGFRTNLAEEKTIDGDLGAPVVPPVSDGDIGTFVVRSGPDFFRVSTLTQGTAVITEGLVETLWCSGGGCSPACAAANYCSKDLAMTTKPEFVKRDTGGGANVLTNIADSATPAGGQWSWDAVNNRILVFDDPAVATTTVTLNGQTESVCTELLDSCGIRITSGAWSQSTVQLDLSQAPDSGKDITRNGTDTGAQTFANVTVPAGGDFTPPEQVQIKGDLNSGIACVTISADSIPSDDPGTPIMISATYFDVPPLGHGGSPDIPAFILIREGTGVASGVTTFGPIIDVTPGFIPSSNNASETIVIGPHWEHNGDNIVFNSLQTSPCAGDAATGDSPYSAFNLYKLDQSGGNLSHCVRLTSNSTDGVNHFGAAPYSELAWSTTDDRVVFAAQDMIGTTKTKLFWVSATSTPAGATGTQFDYPPAGPVLSTNSIWDDVTAGTATINISYTPLIQIVAGNKILVYETDPGTGAITKREVKTVTGITHDPSNSITTIQITPNMTQAFTGSISGGLSYVEYPVTLRQLGQNLVTLDDSAEWFDPDWSGSYAECDAAYRDKLIAVRAALFSSEDTVCGPACATDAYSSTNANIVMISGAKDAGGMYKVDGATSNLMRITQFTPADNSIWPLKPKWSPDCTMIAFLAWDRTPNNNNPDPPSKTSVYIINLAAAYAGFATAALPVTSLSDPGVYKIYDYSSRNMPAYVPNWSADGKLVAYSVDKNNAFDLQQINNNMDAIVQNLFGASDFDAYVEYILDQPLSQGAVFSPQLVGQVSSNELDLVQCPSHAASTCPNKPNTPYAQVAELSPNAGAYLRIFSITDTSTVTNGGGLLFQDGIVTAVFPPNSLASDTVFYDSDPTAYCGGPALPNCAPDPTTEFIVKSGEAREYFPDGTNFESYIRLIFHYCDNDNNGKIDAGTESVVAATSNGTRPFTYSSITGKCQINGVDTSGGTVDIDTLGVYNWDRASSSWVRMDGTVDRAARIITVFASHFSRYDTLGFRMGFAPAALTPLQLLDTHTYPNPYVESVNRAGGITFAASDVVAGDGENVGIEIKVYDIRGSLVTTLAGSINKDDAHENNAHKLYTWIPVANASGRALASGVYMYYLVARTANYQVTQKGKLSIVR